MNVTEQALSRRLGSFEYGVFKVYLDALSETEYKVTTEGFKPPAIIPDTKTYSDLALADKVFKQVVRQAFSRTTDSMLLYP